MRRGQNCRPNRLGLGCPRMCRQPSRTALPPAFVDAVILRSRFVCATQQHATTVKAPQQGILGTPIRCLEWQTSVSSPCEYDVFVGANMKLPRHWISVMPTAVDTLSVNAVGRSSLVMVTQAKIGYALRSLYESYLAAPLILQLERS